MWVPMRLAGMCCVYTMTTRRVSNPMASRTVVSAWLSEIANASLATVLAVAGTTA
jgi:hypothetical protein